MPPHRERSNAATPRAEQCRHTASGASSVSEVRDYGYPHTGGAVGTACVGVAIITEAIVCRRYTIMVAQIHHLKPHHRDSLVAVAIPWSPPLRCVGRRMATILPRNRGLKTRGQPSKKDIACRFRYAPKATHATTSPQQRTLSARIFIMDLSLRVQEPSVTRQSGRPRRPSSH